MGISDIVQSFCSCFLNPPVVRDEEEEVANAWTRVPTIPSRKSVDYAATHPEQQQQQQQEPSVEEVAATSYASQIKDDDDIKPLPADVDQSDNVYPVPWRSSKDPVDLNAIPDVGAVISKPEEVDQTNVHSFSWPTVNKGEKKWGGDEEVIPAELEDKRLDSKETAPLPWEAKLKPVPYDKSTVGPSWDQPQESNDN